MSLRDVTTKAPLRTLLINVPPSDVHTALRGANPALWAELEAIAATPRRCRELTAESVEEIISWTEDHDVLRAIVANDTRLKVASAASARLRELDAAPAPSLNAKNVAERTERALTKADPTAALADLKEVYWPEVGRWFRELPFQRRQEITPSLAAVATQHRAATFCTELFVRSFTEQDGWDTVRLWHRAGFGIAAHDAITAWTDEMNANVAALTALANVNVERVSTGTFSPEAVTALVQGRRYDIIAHLQALTPEELCRTLAADSRLTDRELAGVLHYATSPGHVDALAALLGAPSANTAEAARALRVRGILPATRAVLLRHARADLVVWTFDNEIPAPREELVAYASSLSGENLAGSNELVTELTRSWGRETPLEENANLAALVDALYEHTEGFVQSLLRSYRENWVTRRCMERVAREFASTPDAWRVFFAAAKGHTGTMHDLITAIKSTQ